MADDVQFKIFGSTGAQEIRQALDASGEPPVAQMRPLYEQQQGENITTSEFWQLCLARDQYRQEYARYWQHMDNQTASGRRVDGVIQPVAAHMPGRQGDYQYYAYSAVANVLDIPAVVFPVSPGFEPGEVTSGKTEGCAVLSEEDHMVQANCKTGFAC